VRSSARSAYRTHCARRRSMGEPAMKSNASAAALDKLRAAKGGGATLVEGTPVKQEKSRTD
jgi:hypothetical protein